MSDLAAIIVAMTGLLGVLGAAAKFLWGKVESRFAKVEAALEKCERREEHYNQTSHALLTVITLLCQEVTRLSPGKPNKALQRAHALLTALHTAWPVEETVPPDMKALLAQLDQDLGT